MGFIFFGEFLAKKFKCFHALEWDIAVRKRKSFLNYRIEIDPTDKAKKGSGEIWSSFQKYLPREFKIFLSLFRAFSNPWKIQNLTWVVTK